jgi:ABC-type branched-subunit amino acid transport system ATPase component
MSFNKLLHRYKAVTRVSFLVRQGVWGPLRSPAGPGQSPCIESRSRAIKYMSGTIHVAETKNAKYDYNPHNEIHLICM